MDLETRLDCSQKEPGETPLYLDADMIRNQELPGSLASFLTPNMKGRVSEYVCVVRSVCSLGKWE